MHTTALPAVRAVVIVLSAGSVATPRNGIVGQLRKSAGGSREVAVRANLIQPVSSQATTRKTFPSTVRAFRAWTIVIPPSLRAFTLRARQARCSGVGEYLEVGRIKAAFHDTDILADSAV